MVRVVCEGTRSLVAQAGAVLVRADAGGGARTSDARNLEGHTVDRARAERFVEMRDSALALIQGQQAMMRKTRALLKRARERR